jgi:predicted nuclease of predicted toxin-antitoxin system
MRILLDECLPADLRDSFTALGHECETVRRAGLGAKKNGELLSLAEDRWDVLLTSDRNIKHQQNMTGRRISILVMRAKSNRMGDLLPLVADCEQILKDLRRGSIAEVG